MSELDRSPLIPPTDRSIPAIVGFGVGLSTILATFHYTGHSIAGARKDPDVDQVEKVEQYRRNWRHPSEETVAHLGEGRGLSTGQFSPGTNADERQESTCPVTRTGDARRSRTSTDTKSPRPQHLAEHGRSHVEKHLEMRMDAIKATHEFVPDKFHRPPKTRRDIPVQMHCF